jgi:hypothetical protein
MTFATVKLQPGVKTVQTPVLLQAALWQSNLIRWRQGLPEKIGGWMGFSSFSTPGICRELHPWGDLNFTNHLGIGTTQGAYVMTPVITAPPPFTASPVKVTPLYNLSQPVVNFSTSSGSNVVTVIDAASNLNTFSGLNIQIHVCVGGVVLYGMYPVNTANPPSQFTVLAGANATSTVANGGVVPTYDITVGTFIVTVHCPSHGLSVGSAWPIAVPTTVGGVTLSGLYNVQTVIDPNTFTIIAPNLASSTQSGIYEGTGTVTTPGHTQITYYPTVAPVAGTLGWGGGGGSTNIATLGAITPGTLYTNGTYLNVALTGGTGSGATANITVSGGGVTAVALVSFGMGYAIGNTLSATAASIGGTGSGFSVPVATIGYGWGIGGWGTGSPAPAVTGSPVVPGAAPLDDWAMWNWGNSLLMSPQNGPIFVYDPTSGLQSASVIANGPVATTGFFVSMPQQQIVAYGASVNGIQDPMLVRWCDNANYNSWIASASNQAGSYRLTRGSKIVGGIQGPQQGLLWTDVGLWLMQYIGYPDVYGFFEISQGCGLLGKKAFAVYGPQVFWMSRDGFWVYAGNVAQRVPCDIWDVIIKNLNNSNNGAYYAHIRGAANSGFDEVAWYFPSSASTSGENDMYVKFNVVEGEWDYGFLPVTEWYDNNVFGHPISAMPDATGSNSWIFMHEMTNDANGQPINWMMRTAYFQLAEGEEFVFADMVVPDFTWKRWQDPPSTSAQVTIWLIVQDTPDDDPASGVWIGPYIVNDDTTAFATRARGRFFSAQISGNDLGSFVRLGGVKFRFSADGRASS